MEVKDRAAAQAERANLQALRKDLVALQERKDALTVRAPFDGRVIAPDLGRTSGRFVKLGESILTVASLQTLRVTAVVDNADVPAVREAPVDAVRIKFASDPTQTFTGTVERVDPSATRESPAEGLTNAAGGPVLLDPNAPGDPRALMPWYRVDIVIHTDGQRPAGGLDGHRPLRHRQVSHRPAVLAALPPHPPPPLPHLTAARRGLSGRSGHSGRRVPGATAVGLGRFRQFTIPNS